MKKLEKKYNIKENEAKWQKYWQDADIFKFDWQDADRNNIYSIDTPPPHVSGALHMGHIFSYTQMDIMARFQRMMGKNVFYPIGFDDNGLPSERYVEKKINKKSKSMDRQEFVKICDREIQDAEQFMKDNFIKISHSYDFDLAYRTISPTARKVSQMSFLDLYKKGKLYRKEEPIIWDVVDQTALAQTEAEDKEIESQMNYIEFGIKSEELKNNNSIFNFQFSIFNSADSLHQNSKAVLTPPQGGGDSHSGDKLVIMTTRPELLPACVAIFAHPDDFNKYQGKVAITPLGVEVPILFDESVEKDKGTGVMMCCTFGDGADVEKYKKYNLPLKIIINENGCLYFDNVPEIADKYKSKLDGLFTTKAREEILNILQEEGKIVKAPEKIVHNVKVGERSKSPLEILVKNQWNIDVLSIKDELHKKGSEIKWHPDWMENRIHSWIDGLGWNWTISRQRFFGVPVPCWYSKRNGEEGKVILPNVEDLPVDPTIDLPKGYTKDEVVGETDVFDTWMTSSVSPQLSTQCINENFCCDKDRAGIINLPFDLRPQAHDIIRTWAFCTITKAFYHENKIPWKNIFISGYCLASDGTKMSKSKGNGVDPIKTLNEFGADPIRYWAGKATLGNDTPYSTDVIKNGQKLITKLFNSAKFCEMGFENLKSASNHSPLEGESNEQSSFGGGQKKYSFEKLYTPTALAYSQELRKNTTDAEKLLWYYLKDRQMLDVKFRRQAPIGDYIVDFVSFEEKLVIELDGGQHNENKNIEYDKKRTEFLNSAGYRVLRFWDNEVFENMKGVLETIYNDIVNNAPHQNSKAVLTPPQGGSDSHSFQGGSDSHGFQGESDSLCSTARNDIQNGLIFETMDLWLISRIKKTIENAIKNFNDYNYSSALDTIESFFWNDFCDNYLEIVKARTYGLNFLTYSGIDVSTISQEEQTKIVKGQQSAIRTIYYVFNAVLKLFAPFMPSICDEIYSCVYEDEFNKTKSISSRGNFAKTDDFVENEEIERIGQVVLDVVANVRKEKSEKNISIKEMMEEITISSEFNSKIEKDVDLLKDIKNVCNVKNIIFK